MCTLWLETAGGTWHNLAFVKKMTKVAIPNKSAGIFERQHRSRNDTITLPYDNNLFGWRY